VGPLTWSRAPLACVPVVGKAPKSPSPFWTTRASGTNENLAAVGVSAKDSSEVWIVGAAGTILHTRDHGKTFVRCTIDANEALTAVFASGPDDAWILGTTHVFHVEAAKMVATSPVELQPYAEYFDPVAVFGTSATDVWIANGALLHTVDGGLTWSRPHAPNFASGRCVGEVSGSPSDLWNACNFFVHRSLDGGATWKDSGWQAHTEERVHVSVGPGGDAWVGGQDSLDLGHTTDHGATWTSEPVARPTPSTFWRLWRVWSGGSGWAVIVVEDGVFVRRGKPPWVRELSGTFAFGGSSGADIWAVGPNGTVLHRP
jgi:photosystem II stability/assembly factor-like uncharacterized protein